MAKRTSGKGKGGARMGDEPRRGEAREAAAGGTKGASKKRTTDPRRRVAGYAKSPMPAQHHDRPVLESEIRPRPQYLAPAYRAAGKLAGKRALVTGGDSGIGRAVALLYAKEGADVAIVYLPAEEPDARETQRAVEAEARRCVLLPGDVSSCEFCYAAVDEAVHQLGGLDILVNNAAYQRSQAGLDALDEAQWDQTFRTNIYAYFWFAKAALRHLKKGSAIINTGSITGLEGSKELLDYSATKGAIHAFTKSLAQNLVEKGIRVNCVAPGPVWTPLNPSDNKTPREVAKFGASQPMKRPAQPEEVAPAFVFFASEADSSYITGEVLTLLGGETTAA